MKSKQIKIEFLLPVVLMLIAGGTGGMLARPAGEPDITHKARFGDVIWNHELHARMGGDITCKTCHHQERPGITTPRPCDECHKNPGNQGTILLDLHVKPPETMPGATPKPPEPVDPDEGPPSMEAFHGRCMGCHKAMNEGPVGCRDCHTQTFSGDHGIVKWDHREHSRKMEDLECIDCHHQDEGRSEAEIRSCSLCHQPMAARNMDTATGIIDHEDAIHGECYTCHVVDNPEKGTLLCQECHEQIHPEEGAPSIEEAVHTRCLKCHNTDYDKLEDEMPMECMDCHEPDQSVLPGGTAGPVIWSHRRHAEFEDWTCDKCHHTDLPDEPHMACKRCHSAGNLVREKMPEYVDAVHERCIECHEKLDNAGPMECLGCHSRSDVLGRMMYEISAETVWSDTTLAPYMRESEEGMVWWDHRFHAVSLALSCRECHHNMMLKNGFPFTACLSMKTCTEEDSDPQSCNNCHGTDEGLVEGMEAPKLKVALEKTCRECHQRMEIGPIECVGEECKGNKK